MGQKKRLFVHFDRLNPYHQGQDPPPDTEFTDTTPSHWPTNNSENTTRNFGDHLQVVEDDI